MAAKPERESAAVQPWAERAVEEANLFNPAFCAALVCKAVGDYTKKAAGRPMPFALAFLVLPVVLHRGTRRSLPGSTVTFLLPWLQEHRERLVDFPARARRLKPFGQEAIMFGIARGALAVEDGGGLVVNARKIAVTEKTTELFTFEAHECIDRAAFLGRWFAAAGTPATIFAAWGVAP